jgi:predicted aldo/keto reductase-like oxidoreductase
LGRTNFKVSEIGFGGIPIQQISVNRATEVIQAALDLGINYIDTARAYTDSERKIGRAIKNRRDECYLATKTVERTEEKVKKDLETSLKMLGVSRIDNYQFHSVNDEETLKQIQEPEGPLEAVKVAQNEGKIDYIGISGHRADILAKAIQTDEFDMVMIPFNYVETEPVIELIPLAKKLNVGIAVMKPLGGGRLTEAPTALRFVLDYPVSTVVTGMISVGEVKENVTVTEDMVPLSSAEREKLAAQAAEIGKTFCRSCNYCQPCPNSIQISVIIKMRSTIKRFGIARYMKMASSTLDNYEDCIQCKECEKKCPYKLPILELMAHEVEWFKQNYREKFEELKRH